MLNLLLLYEDLDAGRRGIELCDRLTSQFGEEMRFEIKPWKFDLFAAPRLRELIDADGQSADLVIVSMSEHRRLPVEVHLWLQQWAAQAAGRPVALVGLFHDGSDPTHGTGPAAGQLRDAAARAGADFFHTREQLLAELATVARFIAQRADTITPALAEILSFDFAAPRSHWGINE